MNEGCTLSGSMTITRKADKTMACTFKAVWACTQVVPRSVETDQTCTAKQTGSTGNDHQQDRKDRQGHARHLCRLHAGQLRGGPFPGEDELHRRQRWMVCSIPTDRRPSPSAATST